MAGISDHNLISIQTEFSLNCLPEESYNTDQPEISKFNFERANKELMKNTLTNMDLTNIVQHANNAEDAKQAILNAFIDSAKETKVPTHQNKNINSQSNTIRKLFHAKTKITKKLRKPITLTYRTNLHSQLKAIHQQIIDANKSESFEKERKVAEAIKNNPKAFYAYANRFRKIKSKIGPLKTTNNGIPHHESDPRKMAEILSSQYQSVLSTPSNTLIPDTSLPLTHDLLTDIDIKEEDMTTAVQSIPTWSAPGPDGITPLLLKDYVKEIAPALCLLWRKSLDTGIMPDGTNLAHITPIFKGGAKCEPVNYRPVALTNHITKAFEKILKHEIVMDQSKHQYLNNTQHGFRSGRSTLTNLIEYYESILLLLQHHQDVDSIYLDYSKAFDKCDHNIILRKLHTLGIRGKINTWICGFLKIRQQKVVIRGFQSTPVWCTSGVPQGSVLGPLLFLVLMYDINKGINNSMLSSFADDTKIWKGITTIRHEVLLQDDLDLIYIWAQNNNMEFNSDKFQAIRFAEIFQPCYYSNNIAQNIDHTSIVKDLGIYLSNDLNFEQHIRVVTNRGKQIAGWILRVFSTRNPGVMLTLLKQLIYPTIEYCSILWSPSEQQLINLLESIQRNFLKKIQTQNHNNITDYWDHLEQFKLYSLQRRRERYAIIYTWKVIHNIYPDPGMHLNQISQDHKQHPNEGIHINIHQRNDITVHHQSDKLPKWLKDKSILETCCKLYNCLPLELRLSLEQTVQPSVNGFKTCLDNWLSTIPDQPTIPTRQRPARTNSILHQKEYRQ